MLKPTLKPPQKPTFGGGAFDHDNDGKVGGSLPKPVVKPDPVPVAPDAPVAIPVDPAAAGHPRRWRTPDGVLMTEVYDNSFGGWKPMALPEPPKRP